MRIARIEITDSDAREAEVTVTDGMYLVTTFSCPCMWKVGDVLRRPIIAFMASEVVSVSPQAVYAKKKPSAGYYDQDVVAKVLDSKKGIAAIGEVLLRMQLPFSDEIADGDFVKFIAGRLDLPL